MVNRYRRGATIHVGCAAIIGGFLLVGLGGWPALLALTIAIGVVAAASEARRRKVRDE